MPDPPPSVHVLVADDERALLEELQEFLTWNGMEVTPAGDGVAALVGLAAEPAITVVLTDIRMPSLDGLMLSKRILQARGDADAIEVVLMTGHGSVESAAEAVRAGAFDFLRKPMVLDDVLAVLRGAHAKAVGRRQAHAARLAEMTRLRADYAALQARFARMDKPLDLTADAPPELAHILSHELRTPLIPLLALPDLLSEPNPLPSGLLNAYLGSVQKAGERLKDIGDDLIELLAPPHKDSFVWWPVAPEALLARLEARILPLAREAGIALTRSVLTDGAVVTDEARLLTALRRLVHNALAATSAGGRVELSAHDVQPGRVAFTVRDNGRGMTAAEIAIAKLPFHQLDMSARRRVNGMGLGLTLADRMARRLGGQLVIRSTPGTGTTASIVLTRKQTSGESL